MRLPILLVVPVTVAALAGCGGSSTPSVSPGVRTPPSLAAFFGEPPATPSSCPSTANGTSDGRSSPWVGHVDVSVFLKTSATPRSVRRVGASLRKAATVQRVYFESRAKAYAEFQRLYTCWAEVPSSATPPSYRVVLTPTATIGQRNTLVARLLHDPAVDTASCDPSLPCVDVVRSAQPRS
jgi:hypothetical protein